MHHATTKEQGRLPYHTILPFKVYNGYNVHIGIILLCYVYLQLHRALSPPPRTPSFEDATLEHISVFFFRERGVARELIQPRGNPIARTIIGSAMEFRRILLTGTPYTNTLGSPYASHTRTLRTNYAVRVSVFFCKLKIRSRTYVCIIYHTLRSGLHLRKNTQIGNSNNINI